MTSPLILQYSSLPEPLQLQSHPFDFAFPLPASRLATAGTAASYVSDILSFSFSSLLIVILDRRSVANSVCVSHKHTHVC